MKKTFAVLLLILSCSIFAAESTKGYLLTTYYHTPCTYWGFDGNCISRDFRQRESADAQSLRYILRDYERRIKELESRLQLLEKEL